MTYFIDKMETNLSEYIDKFNLPTVVNNNDDDIIIMLPCSMIARFPYCTKIMLDVYGYEGDLDFSILPEGFDQQEDVDNLIKLLLILSYIQVDRETWAYSFNRDSAQTFKLYTHYVPKLVDKIFNMWIQDWVNVGDDAYSVQQLLSYIACDKPVDLMWLERPTLLEDGIYLLNLILCLHECRSTFKSHEERFYQFLNFTDVLGGKYTVGSQLLKLLKHFPLSLYIICDKERIDLDTNTLLVLTKIIKGNVSKASMYINIISSWINKDVQNLKEIQCKYSEPPLVNGDKLHVRRIMLNMGISEFEIDKCLQYVKACYRVKSDYPTFAPSKYEYTLIRKLIKNFKKL